MENGRITKRVYVGDFAGSRSVSSPRKWWIDTVKDILKKRGLDVSQTRRIVHDRSVWRGFVWRKCMGRSSGDKPLTMTRCHSLMKPWKGENPSVAKPTT